MGLTSVTDLPNVRTDDVKTLYDSLEYINEGRYARVFRAKSIATGETVALKLLTKSALQTPANLRVVAHEIAILYAISHPSICKFIDCFQDAEYIYIVLEYIPGEDLFAYIASRKTLPEADAAYITHQLCDAVRYLHGISVVHRDLKPENVLINPATLAIKVIDFGLSKFVGDHQMFELLDGRSSPMSESSVYTATPLGTPQYLAPEIVRGILAFGVCPRRTTRIGLKKLDVFAIGVVIYVMLFGHYPFSCGNHRTQLMQQERRAFLTNPRYLACSPEAQKLLAAVLDINPANRPAVGTLMVDSWLRLPHERWLANQAEEASLADTAMGPIPATPVVNQGGSALVSASGGNLFPRPRSLSGVAGVSGVAASEASMLAPPSVTSLTNSVLYADSSDSSDEEDGELRDRRREMELCTHSVEGRRSSRCASAAEEGFTTKCGDDEDAINVVSSSGNDIAMAASEDFIPEMALAPPHAIEQSIQVQNSPPIRAGGNGCANQGSEWARFGASITAGGSATIANSATRDVVPGPIFATSITPARKARSDTLPCRPASPSSQSPEKTPPPAPSLAMLASSATAKRSASQGSPLSSTVKWIDTCIPPDTTSTPVWPGDAPTSLREPPTLPVPIASPFRASMSDPYGRPGNGFPA